MLCNNTSHMHFVPCPKEYDIGGSFTTPGVEYKSHSVGSVLAALVADVRR